MAARYDLREVQAVVRRGGKEKIWFSAPSRSISEVIKVYSATNGPKGVAEAITFICDGLLALTDGDFVKTAPQWADDFADIYGLTYDNRPWFVKFIFEGGYLEEISFHPPEQPLVTVRGETISAEEKRNEET